jgi:hypothetical protein
MTGFESRGLMDTKNNGTCGTRGFREVHASLWIKTLRPVCVDVLS